jgi:hypothetical protein
MTAKVTELHPNRAPRMSEAELHERADLHTINTIGFAIALAGPAKVAELCDLLHVQANHLNALDSAQNICDRLCGMETSVTFYENGAKMRLEVIADVHPGDVQ